MQNDTCIQKGVGGQKPNASRDILQWKRQYDISYHHFVIIIFQEKNTTHYIFVTLLNIIVHRNPVSPETHEKYPFTKSRRGVPSLIIPIPPFWKNDICFLIWSSHSMDRHGRVAASGTNFHDNHIDQTVANMASRIGIQLYGECSI